MLFDQEREWREGRMKHSSWLNSIGFGVSVVASGFFLLKLGALETKAVPLAQKLTYYGLASFFLVVLGGALVNLWRVKKFGTTVCELVTNPGVLGGWYLVRIGTKYDFKQGDAVVATLRNIYGSIHHQRETLWQQGITVVRGQMLRDERERWVVPLAFYIPIDCHESLSNKTDTDNAYNWILNIRFDVQGFDHKAEFEVPVRHTPGSSAEVPPEAERLYGLSKEPLEEYDNTSRITLFDRSDDEVVVRVPPDRKNSTLRIMLVISIALSTFALWHAVHLHIIKTILITVFFSPFIFPAAICWIGVDRIAFRQEGVRMEFRLPGYTWIREVPVSKIHGLVHSGSSVYLKLIEDQPKKGGIRRVDTDKKNIAVNLKKGEARWLHRKLMDRIGGWIPDAGYCAEEVGFRP